MAPSLAQKAMRWPRNNLSIDKTLPPKPPREDHVMAENANSRSHNHHHHQHDGASAAPAPASASAAPKVKRTMATVYVGPEKQRFRVNRRLLCASSPFFSDRLEGGGVTNVSLWLPGELPSMFALFVDWLSTPRHTFRQHLDDFVARSHHQHGERGLHDAHWALIRLHLFASHLGMLHLQDSAMDAIQDLYLSCDWDLPPALLSYLYTCCDALPAVRLRRWAVAMVAFSLSTAAASGIDDGFGSRGSSSSAAGDSAASSPISPASVVKMHTRSSSRRRGVSPSGAEPDNDDAGYYGYGYDDYEDHDIDDDYDHASRNRDHHHHDARRFRRLIRSIDELAEDYAVHLSKMAASNLDIRVKNPQLRIPANRLRNDERAFGFRECSFHSHRSTVGERRCPHERKRVRALAALADAGVTDKASLAAPVSSAPVSASASALALPTASSSTANSLAPSPNLSRSSALPPPLVVGRRLLVDKTHVTPAGGATTSMTPRVLAESMGPGGLAPPSRWRDRERSHVHVRSVSSTAR